MLAHLTDASIRSVLLALPAAIVVWIARRQLTAALQHAIWTAVVCGMLTLFAFGQALPRLPLRILDTPPAPVPANTGNRTMSPTLFQETPEAVQLTFPAPENTRRPIDWSAAAVYAYGAIAFAFLARFVMGMFFIRKLRATADPVSYMGADWMYESDRITVPVTIGWLSPRILLPLDWRDWTNAKLDAVLAHEGAHVRRHDGLIAALAHVNRCIFWFHPLAWILERRLALLAEQACDEASVAMLGDRNSYANILLEMASVVDSSHGRMRYHALTMAAGSHIRRRIDLVLQEGRTFSRGLTWAGWTAVLLCGVPVVLCAGAVDLARLPPLPRIEMPRWNIPAPPLSERTIRQPESAPLPVLLAQAQSAPARPAPQSDVSPHFAAVSIQPVPMNTPLKALGGPKGPDPGQLSFVGNLKTLIGDAYHVNPDEVSGPGFITNGRYEVTAQFPSDATPEQFRQMLANLLTERFGLVAYSVTRDVTEYELTVAPGGPKLTPTVPSADTDTPPSPVPGSFARPAPGPDGFPILPPHTTSGSNIVDGMVRMTFRRGTMGGLAGQLKSFLSGSGNLIPVTNQTELTGQFDFRLEFPEPLMQSNVQISANMPPGLQARLQALAQPRGDPNIGPADISAALEKQLGLKLIPVVTRLDFIIVDSVNSAPIDH